MAKADEQIGGPLDKAVGPHTKIRGRCDAGGPTCRSTSASILRAKPDQPAGGRRVNV